MKVLKVFIFGLLYGWVMKIAFDRIYRDNEIEDIRNENASLKEYIRSLEAQLKPKSLEMKSVQDTASQRVTVPAPQPQPVETPAVRSGASEKDNLKVIKGIGPAIEKKLNNAGIHTFAALAALSVEQLEEILGGTKRLVQDEASLIAQAKRLAEQR